MRSKPQEFRVRGQRVLDLIESKAPPEARAQLLDLLLLLQKDPYPGKARPFVSEFRGGSDVPKHTYVAWGEDVHVVYRVAQDQPVVLLAGAHWTPRGGDDDDDESADFPLAA